MKIKPTVDEIKEKYQDYCTVALSTRLKADVTPLKVLKKLKNVSSHCYMLESCDDANETGHYTFLGYDPKAEVSCTNYNVTVIDSFGVKKCVGDPRKYINQILAEHKAPKIEELPNFTGGLVGYFGYDYVKYAVPSLMLDANDDGNFKDVDLMLFDKVIAFDNRKNEIILIVNMQLDNLEENYRMASKELEIMKNIIINGEEAEIEKPKIKTEFKPLFNEKQYTDMVEKAKDYIKEGDIFQVVLSNRLEAEMEGSLFNTYKILRKLNPSPYMFYFSSNDIEMAGASPETLVKLKDGKLSTYPLAGTLSGAPKIRAMQIINELENNKRGIYGGAVGYIDLTGNLDTCIAILLAYKKHSKVYVRSGAGIVADSVTVKEHNECINKAKAVMTALNASGEEE